MERWREYQCGHCKARWKVDARTVPLVVRCTGCGFVGYTVPVDRPQAPAAQALRELAEEMRRAARPYPTGRAPDVAASAVVRWAARLDDIAESVEEGRG